MFPGYDAGETTQRIAAGVFEEIKDYEYGMQFASFYMPGYFLPHIRMMQTGFEDIATAKEFGIDDSTNYAQLVTDKNAFPLVEGTLIWKRSEVGYKDNEKTIIDSTSADYIVKGVADEGLTVDLYLLRKNVKNAE